MAKRYLRRDASQWRTLIEQQRASGRSQAAFCSGKGLALSTFQRWQRLLRESEVRIADPMPGPRDSIGEAAMFTALSLPAPQEAVEAQGDAEWQVELDLGGGVRLSIRRVA